MFHAGVDHHTKMLLDIASKAQIARPKADKLRQDPAYGFAFHDPLRYSRPMSITERIMPLVTKENKVVGFEQATTDILDLLNAKEKDLQVISIVGMGGLGKTTLASKVYNHPMVEDAFSTRSWIFVSRTYTEEDLLLSILKNGNHLFTNPADDERSLVKEVRDYLCWRYLIVVDDVWDIRDWDKIKHFFPNMKNRSRILLTARNMDVAVHANPLIVPYKLRPLTEDQSWELLQIKVFGEKECPQDLIPHGRSITKHCCGLPLAVVSIAGVLRTMNRKDQWQTVAERVDEFLMKDERPHWLKMLDLSYNHLPPQLKACFLYFVVFSEGYEIPVWILIRLWIAERFVQGIEEASLERMAEEYLEDLAARNLVLVVRIGCSGRIKTCRIHDFWHKFCLQRALEKSFLQEINPNDLSSSSSYLNMNRRICINSSSVSKFISSKPCGPHVRSFLCFANDQVNLHHGLVGCIPKGFKLLRVCHVKTISFHRFPKEIQKLVHLTYVALSGDFTTIPAGMYNLQNLQTLIAETSSRNTHTIDIQANILKMSHFRHLHTNKPSQLNGSIAKKSNASSNESVKTLNTIGPESCIEEVLGHTPCVKKLGICGKLTVLFEGNGRSLFDNLTNLKQLMTLKLFNDVSPNPPSEHQLQGLPQWDKFPPYLERLTLLDTFLDWNLMSVLGMLPNLEELKLKDNAFIGARWNLLDGGYAFKKLKALQIWKTDLVYWEAKADNFPSLQHIFLKDCTRLWEIPPTLVNIKELQTIKLHRTSHSAAVSVMKMRQRLQQTMESNVLKIEIFPPDI